MHGQLQNTNLVSAVECAKEDKYQTRAKPGTYILLSKSKITNKQPQVKSGCGQIDNKR